jgi:hypothetical protein
MKMLMTMLVMMLVAVGCGDSDDPVVEAPAEDAVSEVAESDAEVVSDVVSEEDVSTLDVEQEVEMSVEESADVVDNEREESLDEDPTSFRRSSNPSSNFFQPEIP